MSYNADGFQIHTTVGSFTAGSNYVVAYYSTNDLKATVEASGYFNTEAAKLPVGSQITVAFDLDGTPGIAVLVVKTNDGSTVTTGEVAASTAATC